MVQDTFIIIMVRCVWVRGKHAELAHVMGSERAHRRRPGSLAGGPWRKRLYRFRAPITLMPPEEAMMVASQVTRPALYSKRASPLLCCCCGCHTNGSSSTAGRLEPGNSFNYRQPRIPSHVN